MCAAVACGVKSMVILIFLKLSITNNHLTADRLECLDLEATGVAFWPFPAAGVEGNFYPQLACQALSAERPEANGLLGSRGDSNSGFHSLSISAFSAFAHSSTARASSFFKNEASFAKSSS